MLAIVFVLASLLQAATQVVRTNLTSADFYLDALDQTSAYTRLYEEVLADPRLDDVVAPLLGETPAARPLLVSTLRIIVPSDQLRLAADHVTRGWVEYLRGNSSTWLTPVTLSGISDQIRPRVVTYVANRLALPPEEVAPVVDEFVGNARSMIDELRAGREPFSDSDLRPRSNQEAALIARFLLSQAPTPTPALAQQQLATTLAAGDLRGAFAVTAPLYALPGISEPVESFIRDALQHDRLDLARALELVAEGETSPLDTLPALHRQLDFDTAVISLVLMLAALVAMVVVVTAQHRSRTRWIGSTLMMAGLSVVTTAFMASELFNVWVDRRLDGLPPAYPPSLRTLIADITDVLATDAIATVLPAAALMAVLGGALLTSSFAARVVRIPSVSLPSLRRGIGTLGMATLALLAVRGGSPSLLEAAGGLPCNGHQALCERRLDDVVFAGTHNSMSAASEGWILPHHENGIEAQLDAGYRALLLDMHYWGERRPLEQLRPQLSGDRFAALQSLLREAIPAQQGVFLCHGFCELGATPLVDALGAIEAFLSAHPREIVLLLLEDYVQPLDTEAAFAEAGLLPLVYRAQKAAGWPTLGELIERNQRLVVFSDRTGGELDWLLASDEHLQGTPSDVRELSQLSCARQGGRRDAELLLLHHWIAGVPPDQMQAWKINTRDALLRHVDRCERERGERPNIIAVDFYSVGATLAVVDELNGVSSSGRWAPIVGRQRSR
jgi:hypothetical protein